MKQKARPAIKGADVHLGLDLDFLESFSEGVLKVIKFERKCLCPDCRGTRAMKGTIPSKCYACGGTGTVFLRSTDASK